MSRRVRIISAIVLAGVATFSFLNVWALGFAIGAWIGLPGYEGKIRSAQNAANIWSYVAWAAEILAIWLFFLKKKEESVPSSSSQSILTMSLVDKSWSLAGVEYAARLILAALYTALCNAAFLSLYYLAARLIKPPMKF